MSFVFRLVCLLTVFTTLISNARAGGGPENVLVVVNAARPTSLAVANHFVHLRNIPSRNVLYLDQVPEGRLCTFDVFRDRIGDKIVEALQERKIVGWIDYIVFSTDFPTAVNCQQHLEILKKQITIKNEMLFVPTVSTNSLMAFYLFALNDDPSFLGLDANWYMSHQDIGVLSQPFMGDLARTWEQGVAALNGGDSEKAIGIFSDTITRNPRQVAGYYQLARALAQADRNREAIVALRRAVAAGWQYRQYTADDPLLANLDSDSDFQKLLLQMPNARFGQVPTRGFSSQVVWGRNGWPNSEPDQGKRLWLSTMLGVAGSNGGCTRQQIIQQLQRSVAADGTQPMGSVFFSKTRDVRSRTRQPQFTEAVRDLKRLGLRAAEITTRAPQNRADVLGVTLGSAQIDWLGTRSRLLPGALCDNLTSYGGILGGDKAHPQTPLTDFLKMGAAGASGTVVEPLSAAPKFPTARLHVHYARGCCLAEAFYQSVAGPFQLLIVGDPLCQPWARFPKFTVNGLSDGDTVEEMFQLELKTDSDGPNTSRYELHVDGRLIAIVPPSQDKCTVSTADLSDGWHQLRVVAVDDSLIGTRSSQQLEFFTAHHGHQVEFSVAGDGEYKVARSILVSASADVGDEIRIRQNGRVVAVIDGQSGEARIDCYALGVGPSRLTADVQDPQRPDQAISSKPVSIEINP